MDGSCDEWQCTTKNYGRNNRSAYWLKRQNYWSGDEKKKPQIGQDSLKCRANPRGKGGTLHFFVEFPKKSKTLWFSPKKRADYTELIPKTHYNGIVCQKCLSYIKFVSKEDLEKIVERYTGVKKSQK